MTAPEQPRTAHGGGERREGGGGDVEALARVIYEAASDSADASWDDLCALGQGWLYFIQAEKALTFLERRGAERALREAAAELGDLRTDNDKVLRIAQKPIPGVGIGEVTSTFVTCSSVRERLTARADRLRDQDGGGS